MKKIVFALALMFSCAALWATENGKSSEPMDSNWVNKTIAAEEHPSALTFQTPNIKFGLTSTCTNETLRCPIRRF